MRVLTFKKIFAFRNCNSKSCHSVPKLRLFQHIERAEAKGAFVFRTDPRNAYKRCIMISPRRFLGTQRLLIKYKLKHMYMKCPTCKYDQLLKKDPDHPHYILLKSVA